MKPGGRIVNKDHWGRLETPEWERWFGQKELEGILKRHCRHVESRPISDWEDIDSAGLFLVWIATR